MLKDWLAENVSAVLGSRPAVRARSWLGIPPAARANHEIYGIRVPAEVIVYFGDVAAKNYQLEQWLPVLERLNRRRPVLLVFRRVGALRALRGRTRLPMIFVRRFEDLVRLYDENDYRLCLYVNNGISNFQSLSNSRMVHVHVNHGESDKLSMVSNQAKAYDKIMIAGRAARERHRAVLVDFNEANLVTVGRPQLDVDFPPELGPYPGRTIMYAPTWEGENEANNYTSLDKFGVRIVRCVLGAPGTRLVYKPHPRVAGSRTPGVAQAHREILESIEAANRSGGPHVVSEGGNILAMFDRVDALITDVSSVGLDFLYLHPDRPLVITDRRGDRARLERDAPVSRACPVIDGHPGGEVDLVVGSLFEAAGPSERHLEMRRFYFGDIGRGQSTQAFLQAVDQLIEERQEKLKSYQVHGSALDS
jgi:hypothetical protein